MVDVLDKIVNLEFNNQDFERNAKTSLSTLESHSFKTFCGCKITTFF